MRTCNRFFDEAKEGKHLIECVDPFSLDIIQAHSMVYVDADQTKSFLKKVRQGSGDAPVSIVLDNALPTLSSSKG